MSRLSIEDSNYASGTTANGSTANSGARQIQRTGVPLRACWHWFSWRLRFCLCDLVGNSFARAGRQCLTAETNELAVPNVSVITPKVTPGAEEIALPGNMQAFIDTPVWARSSGYLKAWYVDIGGRVKQGQLLAEIEAPEVDQQLLQARAQLQTAEANLKLSQVTADRYTPNCSKPIRYRSKTSITRCKAKRRRRRMWRRPRQTFRAWSS